MNLIYDLWAANDHGEMRHATVVMAELGIAYKRAVPQSVYDQWQFLGCENVPDQLPPYIVKMAEEPKV